MIKAVLFDFDETLQDRTLAFERYMDTFMQKFLPDLPEEEVQKRRRDMVDTGNGGYVNRVNGISP
jgi:beta-phosphoglucomutase-like phosphatase (HAD superfamily)